MTSIAARDNRVSAAKESRNDLTPRFTSASDSFVDLLVIAMLVPGVVLAVIS